MTALLLSPRLGGPLTHLPPPLPRLRVRVPDREAAQRQLWRHAANRLCLSILADVRLPADLPRLTVPASTTAPTEPPRTPLGGDVFRVRAEPLEIVLGGRTLTTAPLVLPVRVAPTGQGARLTLATLRDWPAQLTPEPLFRFDSHRGLLRPKPGLSGDMVALFEGLLAPHARDLLDALDG